MRRAFSSSHILEGQSRAIVEGDPNVNAGFYESLLTPLPKKPRLFCTTPELQALKSKEAGDWKQLSEEDMKQLYDAYFGMTVTDMIRPDDSWKTIVGVVLFISGFTLWLHLFIHTFINPPYVKTVLDQEWINATVKKMLQQHQGDVSGYASKWDYENNRWKK